MKFTWLAVVACALGVGGCASESPPDATTRAQEEFAVIAAAYREFDPDTTSTDTLYIASQFHGSESGDAAETIKLLLNYVSLELARAFVGANAGGGLHSGPPVTGRRNVVFAVDSLLAKVSSNHASVLRYSRPGLNARGDSAVVEISAVCGGLCGHGETMLLAKAPDGRWHLVKRFGQFVM